MPPIARYPSRLLPIILVAVCWSCCVSAASASVVILANRSKQKVDFTLVWSEEKRSRHSLEPGNQVPVAVNGAIEIEYVSGESPAKSTLGPNTIHFFVSAGGKLALANVRFPSPPGELTTPRPTMEGEKLEPLVKIPVMILVDDDEPTVRRVWEARLRKRMEAASDIFQRHCRVRFEVVAVGTWSSDNTILKFGNSLREFEVEVNPAPAVLAVGFTSQYKIPRDRSIHLGGTRGPLYPYILIREWAQHVTSTERLEILVHELGHYLGCVHNSDKTSVMRPKLGDHLSHAKDFRIGFDPANTMAMYLLGEELRKRPSARFYRLSPAAKANLHSLYLGLDKTMKDDDSAERYIQMLRIPIGRPVDRPELKARFIQAAKKVVSAVADAARENRGRPPRPPGDGEPVAATEDGDKPPAYRLTGDELTNFYVRKAASAAAELPESLSRKAFLAALGMVLDSSSTTLYSPITHGFCSRIETNRQRHYRRGNMGIPTMHGDRVLAQRFAHACTVAALCTPVTAEMVGIDTEINGAQRGRDISFNRLTADVAGIGFCLYVNKVDDSLARVANAFTVDAFLPQPEAPEDEVSWNDFLDQYGSAQDDRFRAKKSAIRAKVFALPPFSSRDSG